MSSLTWMTSTYLGKTASTKSRCGLPSKVHTAHLCLLHTQCTSRTVRLHCRYRKWVLVVLVVEVPVVLVVEVPNCSEWNRIEHTLGTHWWDWQDRVQCTRPGYLQDMHHQGLAQDQDQGSARCSTEGWHQSRWGSIGLKSREASSFLHTCSGPAEVWAGLVAG